LGGSLILGAGVRREVFVAVLAVAQLLTVISYVRLRRPAAPGVTVAAGLVSAAAADLMVYSLHPVSLNFVVYVPVIALGIAVAGQFARGPAREELAVSMGAALFVSVTVAGYAAWLALLAVPQGRQALWICAIAVTSAVMAARACDLTLPKPRINRQVPRGAFGVVIGGMVGTAVAAYAAILLENGPEPATAAIGGLVIGLVGVLGDLAAGYTQAGRRISGGGVALWPVRHGIGPLLAFGVAAPVSYLLGVYYLIEGL
ncbi:MAG: hypothetical protein ACRD0P_08005, partial [Stackebrandtia sp.]